jgi:hypothetical protein
VFQLLGEYYASDDFKENFTNGLRDELSAITPEKNGLRGKVSVDYSKLSDD